MQPVQLEQQGGERYTDNVQCVHNSIAASAGRTATEHIMHSKLPNYHKHA